MKKRKKAKKKKVEVKKKKKYPKWIKPISGTHMLTVKLVCTECNEKIKVTTTTPDIYTKEVRDNYRCLLCKSDIKISKKPELETVPAEKKETKLFNLENFKDGK